MPGMLTLDELKALSKSGEIDTVVACFTDLQGRLAGKRFHAPFFCDGAYEETHACNYLLALDMDMETVPGYKAASWERGYGDFTLKPDLKTMRRIPWQPGAALVLCDVQDHHTHKDVPHSPRGILKKQIERIAAKDMKALAASELEFFLFEESYDTIVDRAFKEPKTAARYIEDYSILLSSKEEPYMRALRNGLAGAGITVENSKGEYGPGQEEINVKYSDVLDMADQHSIIKNGAKEIAHQQGRAVTFMAKYDYRYSGNSSHIHMSLWHKDGHSLFFDKAAEHGMSKLMRQFLAGQLKYSREITWFLAPYINSYKRFMVGTFAPTRAIWSFDNRTAGFRLCGADTKAIRVECRIGGADLNPYLAYSALLAAGLRGIDEKLELEPAFAGDAYHAKNLREIPKTLREAIELMKGSEMLREAFGQDAMDHMIHTAEWEQFEYDRRITDWELKRGFERS
ncbi:MAG: glutamine synthetase family protein [Hyphomicrobiaceae bacterium]